LKIGLRSGRSGSGGEGNWWSEDWNGEIREIPLNPASSVVFDSKMRPDCDFCDTLTDGFHSRDFLHTGGFLGIPEISPADLNRNQRREAVRLPLGGQCR
jgi:hypothetical protein